MIEPSGGLRGHAREFPAIIPVTIGAIRIKRRSHGRDLDQFDLAPHRPGLVGMAMADRATDIGADGCVVVVAGIFVVV